MSAKPFPEDVLVNRFWARAAIAVSMNDPEAAMELLRDMVEVEGKIFLTICRPQGVVPRLSSDELAAKGPVFRGRPMHAKWPGRCPVCNIAFGVGASILFNAELGRAAHDQCGEADE
jgi:hypothetical protein